MTDELILEYSNLIYSISHYFEGYKNKEDLYQAGCVGLITAYQKFNPNMGAKFSTYAYSYIFGEMRKLVREDKGIKISRDITKANLKIERAKLMLTQMLMREPTLEELSEYTEMPLEQIVEAVNSVNILTSFDDVLIDDGKELTLYDVVGDHQYDMDRMLAFKEQLENLTPLERELIEKRYMDDMSQGEVAQILGMSQVQVSRKEKKIKEKMMYNMVA